MNYPALTGLRFLAAFYVFIFHIHVRTPLSFLPWYFQNIVNKGALGVTIFFVLSGFILTANYYQKDMNFLNFIKKRLIRIYPDYLVGLLLCLYVNIWLNISTPFPIILANLFMVESLTYPIAMEWYGGGAWSVSTEMFFYFCFPLLLPYLLNLSQKSVYWLLGLVIVASSIPGFLFHFGYLTFNVSYAFPLSRLPEFVAGMLLGILFFRFNVRPNLLAASGSIAFAVFYMVYFSPSFSGYTAHHIFILPAILFLILLLTVKFNWLGSKPMVYLGEISYAFYIVQLPLLIAFDNLVIQQKISPANSLAGVVLFFINLFLAVLVFHWVEVPAMRYFKRR
ncbi:acyltransferase family protein [Adhaeribacter aerolatus]|uniref:acyltransferase family protein n=1 Tax=Adhaeribacter aerolatus TaxID=670289 RepID=UPI0011BFC0A8|nr:acyltransferase [Adhaeribacter aerolatus]